MKRVTPAASPDAYVASLTGWRRTLVEQLRAAVKSGGAREEVIKWGHIVYFSNGPLLLIRAEDERVLFGFWRGKRLQHIEPRLKPGGKFELATLDMREGDGISTTVARKLTREAIALNKLVGDPTKDAKPAVKRAAKGSAKPTAKSRAARRR